MHIFSTFRKSLLSIAATVLLAAFSLLPGQAQAVTFVSATLSTAATKTGVVIAAGQSVVVLAMDGFAQGETLTISDGTNTYVSRGTTSADGGTFTLLDCISPTPGTYTLTLAGATGGGPDFIILIYSGISSYSAGSLKSANFSTTTTATDAVTTASITPTSYPALVVGWAATAEGAALNLAVGTGFTSRFAFGGTGFQNFAEDLTLASGSHIASWTANTTITPMSVLGAAYLATPSGAALAGAATDAISAAGALATTSGPFAPILLANPAHTNGSDQIGMGRGSGTGTGDTAQVAFTKLKQWATDVNTMTAQLFPVRSVQTPVTGFSIAAAAKVTRLILTPAGTLAAGTVTLPPTPADNQPFVLMTSQTITALTVNTADGTTLNGAPTTLAANSSVKWVFDSGAEYLVPRISFNHRKKSTWQQCFATQSGLDLENLRRRGTLQIASPDQRWNAERGISAIVIPGTFRVQS